MANQPQVANQIQVAPIDVAPAARVEDNVLQKINNYLLEDEHLVSKVMSKLEAELKTKKELLLFIIEGVLVLALVFSDVHNQQCLSAILTTMYPVSVSYSFLVAPKKSVVEFEEGYIWLLYWVLYASFETTEAYFCVLPLYWLNKSILFVSLYIPPVNFCKRLFIEFAKPLISLNQIGGIDRDVWLKANPILLKRCNLTEEMLTAMPPLPQGNEKNNPKR